jgi:chromatin remodeling complex protein RSC6
MARQGNPAFMKELRCSEELEEFLGEKKVSRPQLMKKIWKYIKSHKLQDKKDKRTINPDKKLATILGSKPINMFKMAKKLSDHLEA